MQNNHYMMYMQEIQKMIQAKLHTEINKAMNDFKIVHSMKPESFGTYLYTNVIYKGNAVSTSTVFIPNGGNKNV